MTEGLLPEDARFNQLFQWIKLETGLAIGGLLMMAGLGGSAITAFYWTQGSLAGFSQLHLLRLIMPSVFSLTLGVQIVFSSFFLSILGLRRHS